MRRQNMAKISCKLDLHCVVLCTLHHLTFWHTELMQPTFETNWQMPLTEMAVKTCVSFGWLWCMILTQSFSQWHKVFCNVTIWNPEMCNERLQRCSINEKVIVQIVEAQGATRGLQKHLCWKKGPFAAADSLFWQPVKKNGINGNVTTFNCLQLWHFFFCLPSLSRSALAMTWSQTCLNLHQCDFESLFFFFCHFFVFSSASLDCSQTALPITLSESLLSCFCCCHCHSCC